MGTQDRYGNLLMLPDDIQQRLRSLPALFAQHGVQLAYLFGSLAKQGSGNDVDLAVLYEGDITELVSEVIELLGTERVDLVDLNVAPTFLCLEIFRTGRLIHKQSTAFENAFELRILNRHLDWEPILRRQYTILKQRHGL